MIFLAGAFLLGFILAVFALCLRLSPLGLPAGKPARVALGVMATLVLVLLFRPEEEIEIGEDPGVYFNSAASFVQHDALAFRDPAFARIRPEDRILFKYGHAGFMLTKNNSLWSEEISMEETRAHFYPGYSLLLALPMAAGFSYGAFWLSTGLAIMTGFLVAALCRILTASVTGGWIGFFLYFLNPVIFWNARCLRAEWPASFLALAGIVLWLNEAATGGRGRGYAGLLSGLSLAAAGLFHATALYVLLPALALAFFMTTRSRFWAGWWAGAVTGVLLVVGQWAFIADPYFFWPRVQQLFGLSWFLPAGVIAVLFAAGLRWSGGRIGRRFPSWAMRAGTVTGLLAALAIVAVVVYSLRHRTDLGHLPGLPAWSIAYISLTDFEGPARVMSRGWFAFSLLGLFFLGTGSGERGRTGRLLLLLLGPASMTIGWVFNYMFESRRMVTFLVPLITLCSVAGIFGVAKWTGWIVQRFVPSKPGLKRHLVRFLPWVMMLSLLLAGSRGRWHLFMTWNDKGIFDLYQELSDRIVAEGDFLLAEYTQTAAPLESLSGLPLLPVSWGYRKEDEYRKIEEIWRDLVSSSDHERFLFVSPFSGVALPGLHIEPLLTRTLETKKVGRARRSLPLEVHAKKRALYVSRVLPPVKDSGNDEYIRLMDGGNLGLAGQANFMHNRGIIMRGVPARQGEGDVREVEVLRPGRAGTLFVIVAAPAGVRAGALAEGWRFTPIGESWTIVRIPVYGETGDPLVVSLSSKGAVYLTDVFLLPPGASDAARLELSGPAVDFTLSGVHSQWLRARASAALPPGGGDGNLLMLLATHGRDDVREVGLRMKQRVGQADTVSEAITSGWRWYLIPMSSGGNQGEGMLWHDFEVTPAWDPGLSNFPKDLGLRVAVIGTLHNSGKNDAN